MIIYRSTKRQFITDSDHNRIESILESNFKKALGRGTGDSEIASWRNSLPYMANVLRDTDLPDGLGVAIECQVPQTYKRIDFIIAGQCSRRRDHALIVELKQWEAASKTAKDGVVITHLAQTKRETSHPSYQAWSYAALLLNFNAAVYGDKIVVKPCAYLHNCRASIDLFDPHYGTYLDLAPLFLRDDVGRLSGFIKQFIVHDDSSLIIDRIEGGEIRPSKQLADAVVGMLEGNQEFVLLDEQKVIYETAIEMATRPSARKRVLIVEGGPGTGKSVVAINLLANLTGRRQRVRYVSKNSAPRKVYASKLMGTRRRAEIEHLFTGSGDFTETECNALDSLIVDEAHRLNEKSGLFAHLGENQIKELIGAAKCTVFFIDEDQKVTLQDIGDKESIRAWARHHDAEVVEMALESQFRCNGSNGYLAWIDNTLQIRPMANSDFTGIEYDFQVFDSPADLRAAIIAKNGQNRARLVAGYCWEWKSKKDPARWDIEFAADNFRMRWNLDTDGSLWLIQPNSINEVGCIHTCQGLDLDYVGVIIGPDMVARVDGSIMTDPSARAKHDKSVKGWRKMWKESRVQAERLTETIIKNTYRTLMSRGAKGCYVYATDPHLRELLKDTSTSTGAASL